jgi:hypothetical protein
MLMNEIQETSMYKIEDISVAVQIVAMYMGFGRYKHSFNAE